MEIKNWFKRNNPETKLRELRSRLEKVHQQDLTNLGATWVRFQGKSRDEVFDLLRAYTLAQISTPFHTVPWYEWPQHEADTQTMTETLVHFSVPAFRDYVFGFLKGVGERLISVTTISPLTRESRMRLVLATQRGLNFFAPDNTFVTFSGQQFVAESPRLEKLTQPFFGEKFQLNYIKKFLDPILSINYEKKFPSSAQEGNINTSTTLRTSLHSAEGEI